MKRSQIKRGNMPEPKNLKLLVQSCQIEKDNTLNFRWGWNNGHVKQFFVPLKEIEKTKAWVNKYSDGLMK